MKDALAGIKGGARHEHPALLFRTFAGHITLAMSSRVAEFIDRLGKLRPEKSAHPVNDLYELGALIEGSPDAPDAFESIFSFLERHPTADHGAPGPLVHLMESYGGRYESLLLKSVRKAPVSTTLAMVNAILNSLESEDDRLEWIEALATTVANTSFSSEVRDEAKYFVALHKRTG